MAQINADERDPQTFAIIGAAMVVHRTLGHGFLEAVYQAVMEIELASQNIPFQREAPLEISYRNTLLSVSYRADFLCFDSIIVELKALAGLTGKEHAQAVNYLKASGRKQALILNFGTFRLEHKRIVLAWDHLR